MAEKLIGSLIYDDHPIPKKARPLKDRLKVPLAIATVLLVIGGLLYRFVNYREESQVQAFLDAVAAQQYEAAYGMWDADERYDLDDFLVDWGAEGYYTSGPMASLDVIDSNSSGTAVIVYAQIDEGFPVAIMVDKESLLLSYSPENKYQNRR